MNERSQPEPRGAIAQELNSEVLILPDGRILVHNLTQAMAAVLSELNPEDDAIKPRAGAQLRPRTAPDPKDTGVSNDGGALGETRPSSEPTGRARLSERAECTKPDR